MAPPIPGPVRTLAGYVGEGFPPLQAVARFPTHDKGQHYAPKIVPSARKDENTPIEALADPPQKDDSALP